MSEHNNRSSSLIKANQRRLLIALSITGLLTVVEFVGGLLSNSLALLGDAAHMFTDTLALGLSLLALSLARRPASERRTFGYLRAEILAALTNGTVLILISVYIFYEAYKRFVEPHEVMGGLMLVVALVGLLANAVGISILRSASRDNLNLRGALLHMWGDAASSVGVIGAGVVILLTGWTLVDPIVAIVIGVLILRGAVALVWESLHILLESVPRHLGIGEITEEIKRIRGVRDIHDMHLWTITSGTHALSCHVMIDDQMVSSSSEIMQQVNQTLNGKFGIGHSTLQLECQECDCSPVCHIGGDDR